MAFICIPRRQIQTYGPTLGLPGEVLLYLFQFLKEDIDVGRRSFKTGFEELARVCSYRRNFIYASPTLWTSYYFHATTEFGEDDDPLNTSIELEVLDLTRAALSRAPNAGLSFQIFYGVAVEDDDDLLTFACAYSSHWESLALSLSAPYIPEVLLEALSADLPKLQHVDDSVTLPNGNKTVTIPTTHRCWSIL